MVADNVLPCCLQLSFCDFCRLKHLVRDDEREALVQKLRKESVFTACFNPSQKLMRGQISSFPVVICNYFDR